MAILSVTVALPLRDYRLELTLDVEGVVALVGPSGAGKSSVLSAIAGLVRPASGRVALDDEVWFDSAARLSLAPDRRRVGLVFQEYALFPHMTVRQNVAYGGRARVDELLERLRIGELASARPDELSGGERQRVALARALSRDPGVLLLDEPLSALDAHTRVAVRGELADLLAELSLPTLVVTHDYEDAVALAGRVGVMVAGRLRQIGEPARLVSDPADAFVAAFTGANVVRGRVVGRRGTLTEVALETGGLVCSTDERGADVDVVVHPWDIVLTADDGGPAGEGPRNELRAPIVSVLNLGGRVRVRVGPLTAELTSAAAGALRPAPGMPVRATFDVALTRLIARP